MNTDVIPVNPANSGNTKIKILAKLNYCKVRCYLILNITIFDLDLWGSDELSSGDLGPFRGDLAILQATS